MEKESQGIEIRSISIITHQKIKCLHYKTFFVYKIRRMCKSPQCSIGNGPQYSPVLSEIKAQQETKGRDEGKNHFVLPFPRGFDYNNYSCAKNSRLSFGFTEEEQPWGKSFICSERARPGRTASSGCC